MIDALIGIFQSFFILGGAWWGYSYYSGRVKFSGDAEKRRKDRVEKYGTVLFLAVLVSVFGGCILFLFNSYHFLKIFF